MTYCGQDIPFLILAAFLGIFFGVGITLAYKCDTANIRYVVIDKNQIMEGK